MTVAKQKPKSAKRITRAAALAALKKLKACNVARNWFRRSGLSPQKAWEKCVNPGWMLWLLRMMLPPACYDAFEDRVYDVEIRNFDSLYMRKRNYELANTASELKAADYIRKHFPDCPVPRTEAGR